jgi:hypothetical protein
MRSFAPSKGEVAPTPDLLLGFASRFTCLDLALEFFRRMRGVPQSCSKLGAVALAAALGSSCGDITGMDPKNPARGPGQLVGNGDPVSSGNFRGGADALPEARNVRVPGPGQAIDCSSTCQDYCAGLGLENPVNVGICSSMWGVGLQVRPVETLEACRRLYADLVGRYPTPSEIDSVCSLPTWGETVRQLLDTDEYVLVQQRRWADKLLYNNRAVNFERAWDMDDLVGKTYRGFVSWDQFAAVTSAHPVLVRRHDTPGDRAEFLFKLFLGRPPYENERGDMARLYRLWNNGYWTHPHIGTVPDAFVQFECVDARGNPDPERAGECTSVLWGHHELTLTPDYPRMESAGDQAGTMWSGHLLPEEWKKLQLPGRLIASQPAFWEHAVDEALEQLLGYNLAIDAPLVRNELVKVLLEYDGDIRSLHFAIATSFVYLQSTKGVTREDAFRWTYGPLKQIEVEGWIDSIKKTTGVGLSRCDHRLPHPEDYVGQRALEEGVTPWGEALVKHSRWDVDEAERRVVSDYRNLARTLGGCPSNEIGGRFTTVSVLNTAVQESFVAEVCGIGSAEGAELGRLLPNGMSGNQALDAAAAEAILTHQQRIFLGRNPTAEELDEAVASAQQCTPAPCDAAAFARPVCFALLSSSEMLFY